MEARQLWHNNNGQTTTTSQHRQTDKDKPIKTDPSKQMYDKKTMQQEDNITNTKALATRIR